MRNMVRSNVVWQFGMGFVLGAIGLVALQPVDGRQAFISHFSPPAIGNR